MNFFIVKQLPVIPPEFYSSSDEDFLIPKIVELSYTSFDLTGWARDLGYEGAPFPFNAARRAILRAEIDAYYCRMYGLDRNDICFILDPQSVKPGYPSETFAVLKRSEEREFGEYRTQRLLLEAWDKLERGELH